MKAVWLAALVCVCMGATYRTPNFIVQTADPRLAEQFAKTAEQLRRQLAIEWTGSAMPDWSQPCVVTAQVGPLLAAGGATSFLFDRGEVYGWRMTIQGSAERILDSVLPHEITHMVLACRFRCPLPRWADEGAASSVEHPSERARHRQKLVEFLQTGRGIPFSRMFAMADYPPDVMPLYAQGHSLVDFLIQQGGRRKFVDFLADGMRENQWAAAIARHYAIEDLGRLQNTWLAWVARGCPPLKPAPGEPVGPGQQGLLASGGRLPRPEPNLIWRGQPSAAPSPVSRPLVAVDWPEPSSTPSAGVASARQAGATGADGLSAAIERFSRAASRARPAGSGLGAQEPPLRAHLTRPQPFQRPRQMILE